MKNIRYVKSLWLLEWQRCQSLSLWSCRCQQITYR